MYFLKFILWLAEKSNRCLQGFIFLTPLLPTKHLATDASSWEWGLGNIPGRKEMQTVDWLLVHSPYKYSRTEHYIPPLQSKNYNYRSHHKQYIGHGWTLLVVPDLPFLSGGCTVTNFTSRITKPWSCIAAKETSDPWKSIYINFQQLGLLTSNLFAVK